MRTQTINILMFFLLAIHIIAQDISQMYVVGNGKYLSGELIDKNITDANGDVCAGLMIQTDLTGLSYDSNNGIVKINHSNGEDILFLSPNERVVKVLKSGYKPLQIILDEHDIDLESGQMWQLEITGDEKANGLIPITLISKPSGATVYIDGKDKGIGSTFQVAQGEHEVKFERKGSNTLKDTINVTPENIIFSYQLDITQLQVVTISSVPDGAFILIDGEKTGTTNMQKFLAPGPYSLSFQKEGYLSQDLDTNVIFGNSNVFNIQLKELPKIVGDLQFSITPYTADVKLYSDSNIVESWSGLKILNNLLVGNYMIVASSAGYKVLRKEIIIQENEIKVINIELLESAFSESRITFVKGGAFLMGSDEGDDDEKPIRSVTLNDYSIGKYEVSFEEYDEYCEAIVKEKPSDNGWGRGNRPVINVTYEDAVSYCNWLSEQSGESFRLPTEAEWEYASRGGIHSANYKYSGSDSLSIIAWYKDNSDGKTHPVGSKKQNELGIYDMSGNVWEWCGDWYSNNYYNSTPTKNPKGPSTGKYRVLRGGSWGTNDSGTFFRSADRLKDNHNASNKYFGFRYVMEK